MTRPIPHIIRYLLTQLKGYKLQATLNTIVGVLLVFLDLAFVWATKLAVDAATHQTQACTLNQALVLIGTIMLLRILTSLSSRWISTILGVKAQNRMRQHIFTKLLQGQWATLKTFHTGNLTNRLERDVNDVVSFATESIPSFITTFTQFVGAFFFLFFMDSTLAIIIVCVVPFFIISSKLYFKRMRNLTHEARNQESCIQSILQETLQHVLIVKTLQRVDFFITKLSSQQSRLHATILKRTKLSTISSSLLNLGFATGYFVTFAWGATNLSKGLITYGAMLAFIQLVGQIQGPVRNLSKFIPVFIASFTAAERLMELEELPQEEQCPPLKLTPPLQLNLTDVKFQYTHKSRLIFNHFNYKIPRGQRHCHRGRNWSRQDNTNPLVTLTRYTHRGQHCHHRLTRKQLPYDAPHAYKFCVRAARQHTLSGTIRSNLLQGNPSATDEELKQALHIAAADFVFKKADGLDTICGETGDGLSEGQAQRIAIARALLSDGNIFIFDEATSSLDPTTEEIVLQRIITHYPHRTLIFITHRPQVLKYATQKLEL